MSKKLQRLQSALLDWQLEGLLLTRRDNIAWLTEGASYYVTDRADVGVASLFVTADNVQLLAPDNELPRILAEEPMPFECGHKSYSWYQSLDSVLPQGRFGSDQRLVGYQDIQPAMVALRQGLNTNEQHRFRALGQEAAKIVESVARQLRPGVSEYQIEALISAACLSVGIRPVCTLVAADERITAFKHPVPTRKALERMVLITLGAEREGLHVSLSRLVHFGELEIALRQRILSAANIHADILSATQSGRTWSAVFADITQSYQQWGFDGMWRSHHQGGPAGYGCRDFIVTSATEGNVEVDTAVAWNPTLNGVKCEDTFMLTQNGLENLTRSDDDWPMITLQRGALTFQLTDWLVLPLANQETRYE
ncbi:M24 family metallopeptidase [Candidatus Pantoea formicae]|uniref:M24 family metallopeptidase n=1 Tax=Candidatus Pantoea formicae TaxID=2608355 RepID=UPI003EDAC2E4